MNQIEKYKGFRAELAIAETFEDIKIVESKAAAIAEFARRNKVGFDEQNEWGKFRVQIEAKKGGWLEEVFPAGGDRKSKLPQTTLIKHNISKEESVDARLVANEKELAAEVMEEIENDGKIITPSLVATKIKQRKREENLAVQKEDIQNGIGLVDGLFEIIVVDPPWSYGREYNPDSSRVANPYPELSQQQLLKIELPSANDAVLFLWTTHAFIFNAKELLDNWGFEYKATIVWDKQKMGMGLWFRMQCEFCLVGIKGKPLWNNTTWRDIISEPRREHSRKPDIFYKMVDEITVGRKLDYFSRDKKTGWEVFGNDTSKF